MKNLEITQEAAVKAYSEASKNGKLLLENLFGKNVFLVDIKERIKSIEDAINELGENDDEVIVLRALEVAGISNHILYTQWLVVITKALNEGWEPDWGNGQWDKWFNWFNMPSKNGRFSFYCSNYQYSVSVCASRLCFKSKDLAQYAAKQFINTYEKSYTNQ
ncbi:hypothetical protein [Elizabethkingia bruuniana]|uniref:hypothetical protein n=1 Tax=Elizabethkingia bruuniana TaxID=1756149 RepID=UPI00099A0F6B|nr:hypothetical protein [Elizabethkingia bruuniana]OPC53459.1 hypothetical protein BAY07_15525 [Elizabethkingia bruuniana]